MHLARLVDETPRPLRSESYEEPDDSWLSRRLALHAPLWEIASPPVTTSVVVRARERAWWRTENLLRPVSVVAPASLVGLQWRPVDDETANSVLRTRHYLGSPRHDALHLGFVGPSGDLHGLASLAPNDVHACRRAISTVTSPDNSLILARFWLAGGRVPNLGSFAMSRLRYWLSEHRPEVVGLATFLDRWLGFDGALYRASGWREAGTDMPRRLAFYQDRYATIRELVSAGRLRLDDGRLEIVDANVRVFENSSIAPLTVLVCEVSHR